MKVMLLDTNEVRDLPLLEAIPMIEARTAVEAPESAVLDRARDTMTKPRPQPRPAPPREKRRKKR